ncbi:MAG TPA: hypothetical protein VNM90_10530, partial [Haliangium sp.]|nr:hypothetical protein [Haliangium sp.]
MDDETRKALALLMSKSVSAYYAGVKHSIHTLKHAAHTTASFLEGAVFPAIDTMVQMNEQLAQSLMAVIRGDRKWHELMDETSQRVGGGSRFWEMVHTWGRD